MSTKPAEDRQVAAGPTITVSRSGGELAIFDTTTAQIFVCNEVGTRIWEGLCGGRSVEEISSEIAVDFGVSRDRARQDARTFLLELEHFGLLVRRPS